MPGMIAHFIRSQDTERTWVMSIGENNPNDPPVFFNSMNAIIYSRMLQDTYGVDATIKKSSIVEASLFRHSRESMFKVLVRFKTEEDEAQFLLQCAGGLEV